MEHFNQRNTTVVPELSQFVECPVQFHMEKSAFFDTGVEGRHNAIESLLAQPERP
jgi:hypothetical protein